MCAPNFTDFSGNDRITCRDGEWFADVNVGYCHVVSAPVITYEVDDDKTFIGNDGTLHIPHDSELSLRCWWFRRNKTPTWKWNGEDVDWDESLRFLDVEQKWDYEEYFELLIRRVKPEYSGYFSCTTPNQKTHGINIKVVKSTTTPLTSTAITRAGPTITTRPTPIRHNSCTYEHRDLNVLAFLHGKRLIGFHRFSVNYNDVITFRCYDIQSFSLEGSTRVSCGRFSKWIGKIPTCKRLHIRSIESAPVVTYEVDDDKTFVGNDGTLYIPDDSELSLRCWWFRRNKTPTWTWNGEAIEWNESPIFVDFQLSWNNEGYIELVIRKIKTEHSGYFRCTTPNQMSHGINIKVEKTATSSLPMTTITAYELKTTFRPTTTTPKSTTITPKPTTTKPITTVTTETTITIQQATYPFLIGHNTCSYEPKDQNVLAVLKGRQLIGFSRYSVSYNDVITFRCYDILNFFVEGSKTVRCGLNGDWIGTIPTCTKLHIRSIYSAPVISYEVDDDETFVGIDGTLYIAEDSELSLRCWWFRKYETPTWKWNGEKVGDNKSSRFLDVEQNDSSPPIEFLSNGPIERLDNGDYWTHSNASQYFFCYFGKQEIQPLMTLNGEKVDSKDYGFKPEKRAWLLRLNGRDSTATSLKFTCQSPLANKDYSNSVTVYLGNKCILHEDDLPKQHNAVATSSTRRYPFYVYGHTVEFQCASTGINTVIPMSITLHNIIRHVIYLQSEMTCQSTMPVKTGDLILKSKPFSYVVKDDHLGRVCDYCRNPDESETFGNLSRRFRDLMSHPKPDATIYGKITVNAFGIGSDSSQLGIGLYLGASIFDHSCRPNSGVSFDGSVLRVNAIEDISKVDISNDLIASIILCPNTNCTHPTVIKNNSFFCRQCGEVEFEKGKLNQIEKLTAKCNATLSEMLCYQGQIMAVSAFKRGDLIFKSQPFAYVVSNDFRGRACDYCLKLNRNLRKCMQCSFSYYCDKVCQKATWKDHKQECLNLKNSNSDEYPESVFLAARIIYKLKRKPDDFEKVGNVTRRFQDLMSHCAEIKQEVIFYDKIKLIRNFIPPDECPSVEELFDIFGKIAINANFICDENEVEIGMGLYLGGSLFDHSCKPNASIRFYGIQLCVTAIEEISQFDTANIFISYIDIAFPTERRRKQLKENYYFDCNCERCQDEERDLITNSILCPHKNCKHPTLIKKDSFYCLECGEVKFKENKRHEICEMTEKCKIILAQMSQLKKEKRFQELYQILQGECIRQMKMTFHILNVNYMRILEYAFDATSIPLRKWKPACEYGKQLVICCRHYYGDVHPIFIYILQFYFQSKSFSMLFCIFVVFAVASSFAAADDCFDAAKYIRKVVKPVHAKCKAEVIDFKAKHKKAKKDCERIAFVYSACNNRELGINDEYQHKDHAKFVKLLKSFSTAGKKNGLTSKLSVCDADSLVKTGNRGQYFDCLQKQCPEVKKIRADYLSANFVYCVCHNRELGINLNFQQKDHEKFVDLLKSFSAVNDTYQQKHHVKFMDLLKSFSTAEVSTEFSNS
uniref:MYND-type domain-containing protein n=1 Tax=Strigamia maritima TaxID=126957 RepID=T1IQ96_STRMM